MDNSEIYEQTKQYLRGETSLRDLHHWVFARLQALLRHEGSPEYELASLIVHCFAEYAIDRNEEEFAKALRRFLASKKVAISL